MEQIQGASPANYLDWAIKGRPAIWRYVLALVLAYVLWIFLPLPLIVGLKILWKDADLGGPLGLYLFLPGFIAMPFLVRFLLGRPAWSIGLAGWPMRWGDYGYGILMGLVVAVLGLAACSPLLPVTYQGFGGLASAGPIVIAFTILGFVIQTGFEEMLFRGLLAQFTRRIVNFLPLVILVQALIFGSMHLGNVKGWGGNLWSITPYVMTACVWGWAAWRTGSLLVTAALHFVNNATNALFVGTKGDIIQSIAPLTVETPTITVGIVVTAINLLLTIVLVEIYMRWRRAPNPDVDRSAPI